MKKLRIEKFEDWTKELSGPIDHIFVIPLVVSLNEEGLLQDLKNCYI
jgi:hypothetical protein